MIWVWILTEWELADLNCLKIVDINCFVVTKLVVANKTFNLSIFSPRPVYTCHYQLF